MDLWQLFPRQDHLFGNWPRLTFWNVLNQRQLFGLIRRPSQVLLSLFFFGSNGRLLIPFRDAHPKTHDDHERDRKQEKDFKRNRFEDFRKVSGQFFLGYCRQFHAANGLLVIEEYRPNLDVLDVTAVQLVKVEVTEVIFSRQKITEDSRVVLSVTVTTSEVFRDGFDVQGHFRTVIKCVEDPCVQEAINARPIIRNRDRWRMLRKIFVIGTVGKCDNGLLTSRNPRLAFTHFILREK